KEAQIKLYKTREDKELDKVIELENKVKVLDNIVNKTGQSVQTMNMLNNKCRTSFTKPEFLKKAQRANPRLPQLKRNPQGDKVMHNNSQGKKQEVEDQRRSVNEPPPLAVGNYTASGNSLLAMGMPSAFYSQQENLSSRGTDLYLITLQDTSSPNPICLMAKATSSQAWLWHHRLSHLNFDTIKLLSKNDIVVGLPKLKFVKDQLSSSCTEFLNQTLHAYFAAEGILHQTAVARLPEQNGVVERRNRTLVEADRTMLSAVKVPLFFWVEAIATACFTQNRSLSRAYRVFNKRTRVIMESIHVNFDELPQMASDHVSSDPAPECQRMALEHGSLSPGPQYQDNVTQADRIVTTLNELDFLFSLMFDELLNGSSKVVSKSSAVSTVDAPNQCQQHTTPLNNHTTPAPTCQVLTQAVMSPDSHATITYTSMSSYKVIFNGYFGIPMDPLDPYVQLIMEAPPSPDYIPGPEAPPSPDYIPRPEAPTSPDYIPGPEAPPSPDYIPGPEYLEYLPPADDVLPAEEQPLLAAVSPTAKTPGYITDSDPEMEPKEEDGDDEKSKRDSIEYPTSRGDDDTDDDGDDFLEDDADEEESSDSEEEEEEHLAMTVPAPALHSSISASEDSDETELFEEGKTAATPPFGYHVAARISVQPHILMPFRSESEVERLLAIPTPPLSLVSPTSYPLPPFLMPLPTFTPLPPPPFILPRTRASMALMRSAAPSTFILAPRSRIPLIGTPSIESTLEADMPLRKRARFTTSTGGYEVGESSIAAAARQIRPALTVADSRRAEDRLIGRLRRERRYFRTLSTTYAQEVAHSCDYCTQIMDYCQSRERDVSTLQRQQIDDEDRLMRHIQHEHAQRDAVPEDGDSCS
nr:hypothetical protein [Tanacetum cinerariifolium]